MGYFSNGTEGDIYQEDYCDKCVHDKNQDCVVWLMHLAYSYELCNSKDLAKKFLDMLIPRKGLYNDKCAMFVAKEGER